MHKPKQYDFIIPIGSVCTTAHNLRINKLQRESLPFDWIWISGLPVIHTWFADGFKNFMKKENLLFIKNNGDADVYRDTLTKAEFWHDFMLGCDFDKAYEQNYLKYQRRIKRMYNRIERSQKILWVRVVKIFPEKEKTDDDFMFENALPSPEQTIQEFTEFQKLYPQKQFDLLLFYFHDNPCERQEYDITPQIHICEMYNSSAFGWQGNTKEMSEVLAHYSLTLSAKLYYAFNTLIFKCRKFPLKLMALFGNKNYKQKLKQRD